MERSELYSHFNGSIKWMYMYAHMLILYDVMHVCTDVCVFARTNET